VDFPFERNAGLVSNAINYMNRELGRVGVGLRVGSIAEKTTGAVAGVDGIYAIFAGAGTVDGRPSARHVMLAERYGDDVTFFDPQQGRWMSHDEVTSEYGPYESVPIHEVE
jgi:hypothetical protein